MSEQWCGLLSAEYRRPVRRGSVFLHVKAREKLLGSVAEHGISYSTFFDWLASSPDSCRDTSYTSGKAAQSHVQHHPVLEKNLKKTGAVPTSPADSAASSARRSDRLAGARVCPASVQSVCGALA